MPSTAVLKALAAFVEERDWAQFHSGANLAKSVAIESGELLELFQWTDEAPRHEVAAELADVLSYCYLLAMKLDLDADRIVLDKLEQTRTKYPVEKARGRSDKYDQLPD